MTDLADILVVGGGIAGLSVAALAAPHGRVMLVEAEARPGFHATGRSVAFWSESYGGPAIQPLTSASGPLLRDPTPMLGEEGFLSTCGALHVGRDGDRDAAAALVADFARSGVPLQPMPPDALAARLPGLRAGWTLGIDEPSCADIDAARLLAAFAGAARRGGAHLALDRQLVSARREGSGWLARTGDGANIACGTIVNAGGAWADEVAERCGVRPLGIRPYRRTVVQLRSPAVPAALPLVIDLAGRFYFKRAGAGRLWLSPHDEVPDIARDVAAEELDIAVAVHRFGEVMDWPVEAVEHSWAGLRSFAPDRLPVYGFDGAVPGFFWCAGQGGFGIQTAPAAALLAAALLLGQAPAAAVAGIDPAPYAPTRPALTSA